MPYSVQYCFSQLFSASARKAYTWCTDYSPRDHVLMGEENAERQVTHLAENTIIIIDIFHTGKGDIEKQKLLQLYPDRFCWVSTHLTGQNKYSQFIYESAESNGASRLDFNALHLEYERLNWTAKTLKCWLASCKKRILRLGSF